MSYVGIIYIGYDEKWKVIEFEDIMPNTYEVSDLGRFRKLKNKKMLFGCNPKNERGGYHRIALKNNEGKVKKYQKHRIVLAMFGDYDPDMEVNHKDGDKNMNTIWNLEKIDRKGNAEHAAENLLYKSGEKHYRASFTNDEVNRICSLLEKGIAISRIISIMGLSDRKNIYSNIDKIANKKSWTRISKNYNIDWKKYHYKTYSYDDIYKACYYVFDTDKKNSEIAKLFPKYDNRKFKILLKSLRKKRVHKRVIKDYMCSSTRERTS